MLQKQSLKISGMSCAACAARLEKGLQRQPGVQSAQVNLATERATVEYDDEQLKPESLAEVVTELGFKASAVQDPRRAHVDLQISGMHCAACSARTEKKLQSLPGVRQVNVNLSTERASVDYDAEQISPSALIDAVTELGFGAQSWQESDVDLEQEQKEKEILRLRRRLGAAILLSSPLVLAMFLSLFRVDLPLLGFLHNAYFQWAVATPVQFIIGLPFYIQSYYALRSKAANMDVLIALGTSAAYFFSLYNIFFQTVAAGEMKHLYFEAAAIIITLILLGKYLRY